MPRPACLRAATQTEAMSAGAPLALMVMEECRMSGGGGLLVRRVEGNHVAARTRATCRIGVIKLPNLASSGIGLGWAEEGERRSVPWLLQKCSVDITFAGPVGRFLTPVSARCPIFDVIPGLSVPVSRRATRSRCRPLVRRHTGGSNRC